ncbi:MAG: hypothetical protein KGL53_13835, partial [Elusimicrobia bacterium]|nr:hypothetical protein [Elusimicrobiota bacterium]
LVSAAFLAGLEFQHAWMPEVDAYFHIKTAWLMTHHGLFHGFPWAADSLWNDVYSDTCFLFHVYLMPFTFFSSLAFGAKLAASLLAAAVFTSLHWILRRDGVRWAGAWTVMLALSGPYFIWRIDTPRPQVLSVLLALWSVHFLVNRRRRAFLVTCFLFPFAYAAAFLPVIFAAAVSLQRLAAYDEPDWRTPAWAAAACLAGLCFHPYFPNDFLMLYVQDFYVLWMKLFGHVHLELGQELSAMDTKNLVASHAPLVCAWLALVQLAALTGRKPGERTQALAALAFLGVGMMFVVQRFVEYAVPLLILYLAARADELLSQPDLERTLRLTTERKSAAIALLVAFAALGSSAQLWAEVRAYNNTYPSTLGGAAAYLEAHAAPGERVFTCHWGDGPQLLFYDSDQRYMVLMDPTFMYYWSPAVWKTWRDVAEAKLGAATYPALRDVFGARYGVCGKGFEPLYNLVKADPRFEVPYEAKGTFVFRLKPMPRNARPPAHAARLTKPAHGHPRGR